MKTAKKVPAKTGKSVKAKAKAVSKGMAASMKALGIKARTVETYEDVKAKAAKAVKNIATEAKKPEVVPALPPTVPAPAQSGPVMSSLPAAPTLPTATAAPALAAKPVIYSEAYPCGWEENTNGNGKPSQYWCQFAASSAWKSEIEAMLRACGFDSQGQMVAHILHDMLMKWSAANHRAVVGYVKKS